MIQDGSIFSDSPLSFNSYSCDNFAEIAAKVCEEFTDDRIQLGLEPLQKQEEIDDLLLQEKEEKENEEEIEEEEKEFEFSFFSAGNEIEISVADEIFANGQIRPVFPVFNQSDLFYTQESKQNASLRKLFIQERDENDHSCSSSEAGDLDELDSLPAGTYCVWKPKQTTTVSSSSPETCKKSRSTGSSSSSTASNTNASVSKRWRLRDFLFRSNSDGKNTFVFLTPPPPKNRKEEEEKLVTEKLEKVVVSGGGKVAAGKGKLKTGEVSAHEIHYVRNRALKENDRKKSYLPYRQDLVGFFANVNGGGGLTRKLHPF